MRIALRSAVLGIVFCLIASHVTAQASPEGRLTDEAAIAEAVLRYEFQNNGAKAEAYFVGLGPPSSLKDPQPEFLKRFADVAPVVR